MFSYNEESKTFSAGKRPNNQSSPKTLQKISRNIRKAKDEGNELVPVQETFQRLMVAHGSKKVPLKTNKIDIAHAFPISAITNSLADTMNEPSDQQVRRACDFVEDMISSDREDSKETVKDCIKKAADENLLPPERIQCASQAATRLNCASKNLMPGHASTNRSIGNHIDPHLFKSEDGGYKKTKFFKKTSQSAALFFTQPCEPKQGENEKGEITYQSSSISNVPGEAYGSIVESSDDSTSELESNLDDIKRGCGH